MSFTEIPGKGSARRVLVVEDNSINRYMLTQHVTQLGHTVTQAENGVQALERMAEAPFDLVLLDMMMPEMDGYAVLERMQGDPELREIPVIVISGLDEVDSVVRCIERGAADYLTKPFNPVLLRARIGACLEKKQLWDNLRDNYRALQELEKLRDSLTHMVVHDLRTPLTSVLTGLYTIESMGELTEEQRECWSMAVMGSETLLAMINDLLDISKMEDGSLRLDYSDPSPEMLVERSLQQVLQLAREKRISMRTELDADLPPLRADEDKLRRTLVNLLSNAVKFTPEEGEIAVRCRRQSEEGSLLFSITDNGEGIPEEAFAKIFEKFGQVESRKRGRKNSTGLGLTFCKMAVEAHGGRIWVESSLGAGSTFHFTVPHHA